MEKLNDGAKEKGDLQVNQEPVEAKAEAPSIHGSGEAMWLLDRSQVDVMPESYEVTTEDGKTYTHKNEVSMSSSHFRHIDVENAVNTPLQHEAGDCGRYSEPHQFTPGEPVTKPAEQKPASLSELGEEGKGASYTKGEGTLEKPNTDFGFYPNSLFIDGITHPEDIQQYDIGDCYFLAALLSVIRSNPSYIPKIMHTANGLVRTNFYHLEGTGANAHWVSKPIETKLGLMGSNGAHGAFFRVASKPKESVWSAEVNRNTLSINRKGMYEAALWVNCIENAYTYYARLYGQYGGSSRDEAEVARRDGEAIVNEGGSAGFCLHILMGDEVSDARVNGDFSHNREEGIWAGSECLIAELMKMALTQDGSKKENTFISVSAHKDKIAPRCEVYLKALTAEIEAEIESESDKGKKSDLKKALGVLEDISSLLQDYIEEAVTGNREGEKSRAEIKICARLHDAQMKLAANETLVTLNNGNYIALRSILGTIIEDPSSDIFIYKRHGYNVAHVDFRDKEGKPINVGISTTLEELEELADLDKSTVTLENPHGRNKAVRPGETVTRPDEGVFTASLRETLASVTQFSSAQADNPLKAGDESAQSIENSGAAEACERLNSNQFSKPGSMYEYWNFNGDAKGEILHEQDVSERGDRKYVHLDDHEGLLNISDIFTQLDSKGNQTALPQSEVSQSQRQISGGKKYKVTEGIRTVSMPSPKELYTEDKTGVDVEYFQGTIKDPNLSSDIIPGSLFIDDTPSAQDVLQGGLGDCCFLASVLHVLNTEPTRIKGMMSMQGNEVDVAFYHREGNGSWTPVHVRTKWGYTGSVDSKGTVQSAGSKIRISAAPKGAPLWKASIKNQTLSVTKRSMYEAAMWVNLMENAYDLFAEKYGKYGRGTADNADNADQGNLGRMGSIRWGKSECLQLFFGKNADNHSNHEVKVGENSDIRKDNEAIYQALIDFTHPGVKDLGDDTCKYTQSMICASFAASTLISRLKMLSKSVQKEAHKSKDPKIVEAQPILDEMIGYIDQADALINAGTSGSPVTNEVILKLSESNLKLTGYNEALKKLPSWHKFRNLSNSIQDMTQHNSVLAEQAYNVKKVELLDKKGNKLDTEDVKELVKKVDLQKSRITMQDPRGANAPVQNSGSGEFVLSLEDYLWSTDHMAVSAISYNSSGIMLVR